MRFDAAALVADQFRFEDDAAGGKKDHVALGKSGGVTGFYEYGTAHVVDAQAVLFEVTSALWHLDGGHVSATKPSRLDGVTLRLNVPASDGPTTMHLELESATLGGFAWVDGDMSVEGAGTVEGVTVDLGDDGKLTVTAAKVSLRAVRVVSGTTAVAIAEARIDGLTVVSLGDSLGVTATRVNVVGVKTSLEGVPLEIGRAEAKTASYRDGHIEVGELGLLGAAAEYAFPPAPPPGAPSPPDASAGLPDLPALDVIDGTVAVDVRVTADVPVLPDKIVSQKLRIPIAAGSIDYAALERSLSILGDALIDFEVQGDELVLELDIVPIVKFDNVTLVSWSLADAIDRDLAKQKRVRLRRLLHYRTPPAKPGSAASASTKKKVFRLLGIDFADIDVALALTAPTELAVGGGTIRIDAVQALHVTGGLHVAVDGASAPGRLDASAGGITAALTKVDLGALTIARATLVVGKVDPIRADFSDLSPSNVRGTIVDAKITDLALDLAP